MNPVQNTMTLRPINAHLFDVFWEDGWENWARVQNKTGFLKQVNGKDIPKPVFAKLITMHKKEK